MTLLGPGLTLLGPGLTLVGPGLTLLGASSEVNTSSDVLVAHEFSWSVKGVCLVVGGAAAKTTIQKQETEWEHFTITHPCMYNVSAEPQT